MGRNEQIGIEAQQYSSEKSEKAFDSPTWEDIRIAFEEGAKWADANKDFFDFKKVINGVIEGIEDGSYGVVCQYNHDKNLMKAFHDGEVSSLKLILTYIHAKENHIF